MDKKIISLFLSFCLMLMALPVLAESTAESAVSDASKRKIAELSALGILNNMNVVEFEAERTVVKKVFYSALYRIMTDEA